VAITAAWAPALVRCGVSQDLGDGDVNMDIDGVHTHRMWIVLQTFADRTIQREPRRTR